MLRESNHPVQNHEVSQEFEIESHSSSSRRTLAPGKKTESPHQLSMSPDLTETNEKTALKTGPKSDGIACWMFFP